MLNATEILEGLKSRAVFLYPWVLAWLVWIKNSGTQSDQIPYEIPLVQLCDFSHPNKIPGKECPYAIDGERYFFTKQVPRDASRKRSKRKAGEQGAFWKSTSTDIHVRDLRGKLIGYLRKYTLCEDKDDKRSANWYMEEYRVHDPHELVDPYVLCKIYHKDSFCPKYTKTSIRALRKRFIERQLGSRLDQTNSNRNQAQTQFDGSDSHEDIISTPHDASGNQNRPESIPWNSNLSQSQFDNNFGEDLCMQQSLPTSESFPLDSIPPIPSNGFSRPHDASGSQNPPESIAQPPCLYSDDFLDELMAWT